MYRLVIIVAVTIAALGVVILATRPIAGNDDQRSAALPWANPAMRGTNVPATDGIAECELEDSMAWLDGLRADWHSTGEAK